MNDTRTRENPLSLAERYRRKYGKPGTLGERLCDENARLRAALTDIMNGSPGHQSIARRALGLLTPDDLAQERKI